MTDFQIIKNDPIDWKMLQHDVSTILKDCGYETDTEKTLETVRGKVEVDVIAKKNMAYTINNVLYICG